MISFNLCCEAGHEFDGWFRSSEDFEEQVAKSVLSCPVCGSVKVEKALMAPNVGAKSNRASEGAPAKVAAGQTEEAAELVQRIKQLREHVLQNSEYVGDKFAEEARRIHYDESPERGIHGEATLDEAKDLHEEGIGVLPLPVLPEDHH